MNHALAAHRSAIAWPLSAALAVATTNLHIRLSLKFGALALPPTYDDVSYFLDAATRLDVISRSGLLGFGADYASRPPHSPGMTLLAMAGFALFGVKPWAACAAMAIPLAVIARTFFALSKDLPIWLSALTLLAFLVAPLTDILIVEFRPDALCGIVTAGGALYIVMGRWSSGDTRACILAGALLALALWIKPTVFAITFGLFGLAMAAASAPQLWSLRHVRKIARSVTITLATGIALAAPHYVFGFETTLRYFIINVLGEHADVWARKLPPRDHLLYYLVGEGGGFTMGAWLFAALVMAVCWTVLAFHRDERGTGWMVGRILVLVLVCLLVVSGAAHKTPFVGISLTCFFMLILAISMVATLRSLLRWRGPIAGLMLVSVLLAFAAFEFSTPWARHGAAPVSAVEASNKRRMLAETVEALSTQVPRGGAVVLSSISHYLQPHLIRFVMLQGGHTPPVILDFHVHGTTAPYRAALLRADAAIAFAPDAEVIMWLPSASLRKNFLDDLRDQPTWRLVRTIHDASGKGPVYVFRREGSPTQRQ